MPLWIVLVVIAQAMSAAVSLMDRYLVVSEKMGRPLVLTFYTSVLSVGALLIFVLGWFPITFDAFTIPSFSNVEWPTLSILGYSLVAALTFVLALLALFESFRLAQASDVVPVVTSVNAVVTLLLSFYVFDTVLPPNALWGFLFLVVGTFLVAHFRLNKKLALLTGISGALFAIHFVLLKVLFLETTFDNAFFWSRMCIVVVALCMLFLPNCCQQTVARGARRAKLSGLVILFVSKTLAGISGIILLKAIEFGDISIVQALSGLQFVFLVFFAIFFGHKAPTCVGENCEMHDRIQKIVSVSIIVTGFVVLFI
jgi:drug/metabolite transporter (DMT)-like permease